MNYDDINKEAAARAFFDKIKHIVLVNEWSDDHIPCATVNIELYDGTVLHESQEAADELDIKAERLILELADLDINSFDGE